MLDIKTCTERKHVLTYNLLARANAYGWRSLQKFCDKGIVQVIMRDDEIKREERIRKLTNEPVYPLLVRMAVPSTVGMIVSTVYSMTDTFFVGKLNNVALTASVGIVFSFVSVIQAIGFWFG